MKCILSVLLFSFLRIAGSSGLFTEVPTSLKPRSHFRHSSSRLHSSSSNNNNNNNNNNNKPILVVGATGKVGRKVVQQLLSLDRPMPVRALVRNQEKAEELFADYLSSTTADKNKNKNKNKNKLELVVCDLSTADSDSLEAAVQGCEAIISVSGAMRFSKLTDFLPWRLFQQDASRWCSDTSHPYYSNYQAQKLLIDLASKHKCSRFVRLTGLSSGFSPFNPVSMIFSSVLSLTSRYHFLCEQYLRNSKVPYVILRPGGLAEDDRGGKTHLQVDASGSLPPPGRVPRTDVAALAALSVGNDSALDPSSSYTLAVRAVGDMKPKPQGLKEEGLPTPQECLQSCRENADTIDKTVTSKPYGLAVGVFVYSLLLISAQVAKMLIMAVLNTISF